MNTALRAVVRTCAFNNIDCVGVSRGYQGLINDDIKSLKTRSVRGIINRGGTMLYSARSDEFRTSEGRKKAKLNKQIAFDLTIAETTVKAHVTAIMRKLGVQSRTQAVLIAKEASFSNVLQERV